MAHLTKQHGAADARTAQSILEWARAKQLCIWWGRGTNSGSFFPLLDVGSDTHWLISVWTYGTIEVQFQMMKKRPPFDMVEKRMELLNRFNAVPGISIPASRVNLRPNVKLSALADRTALQQFLAVFDWVIQQIKSQ